MMMMIRIAQQHEHVPDAQLRGERDRVVEQREVPAGAVGGRADAELAQLGRDFPVRQPARLKLVERLHEPVEAGLVEALKAAQLPQPHEHHEGHFFVVVAEQGGGEGGHALHVARVWEVDGEAVQDAEEEALAAAVTPAEHNVAVYGPGDVDVDLDVVRAGLLKEVGEGSFQVVVAGERLVSPLGAGGEESVPCGCSPPVGYSFPSSLDHFGRFGVEVEGHASSDLFAAAAVHNLSHLLPFLFTAPLPKAGRFDCSAVLLFLAGFR